MVGDGDDDASEVIFQRLIEPPVIARHIDGNDDIVRAQGGQKPVHGDHRTLKSAAAGSQRRQFVDELQGEAPCAVAPNGQHRPVEVGEVGYCSLEASRVGLIERSLNVGGVESTEWSRIARRDANPPSGTLEPSRHLCASCGLQLRVAIEPQLVRGPHHRRHAHRSEFSQFGHRGECRHVGRFGDRPGDAPLGCGQTRSSASDHRRQILPRGVIGDGVEVWNNDTHIGYAIGMVIPPASADAFEIPAIGWDAPIGDPGFDPSYAVDEESVVALATRLAVSLPCAGDLLEFAARPSPAGALLVRNVPIGEIGATPAFPGARDEEWTRPELLLLAAARLLGHPIGYAPEHGGRLVQDIVPVKGTENLQVSTSSSGDLLFHTETAFHPHRPRHLLLLCLRGEPAAATTLLSVGELIEGLDESVVEILNQPRFATAVDLSFLDGRRNVRGEPHRVLGGARHDPTLLFDADLTVGLDAEASQAVTAVNECISRTHRSLVLEAGDLLVVDNARAVHGRSSYQARFDGTDRWLMRAFTVADLCLSTADRQGRIITTIFGNI